MNEWITNEELIPYEFRINEQWINNEWLNKKWGINDDT